MDQLRFYGCGSILTYSKWTNDTILANKQEWVNQMDTYLASIDETTFNESINKELEYYKDTHSSANSAYSIFGTDLNPASSLSQASTHFNKEIGLINQTTPQSNDSINSQIVSSQHSNATTTRNKIELNPFGAPLFPPAPSPPPNHTPAHKKRRLLNNTAQIAKQGGLDPKSTHKALDKARKQSNRRRSVSPASKQLQFKKSNFTSIALSNFLQFKNDDAPILLQRFKEAMTKAPTPSITTSTTLEDIDMLATHAKNVGAKPTPLQNPTLTPTTNNACLQIRSQPTTQTANFQSHGSSKSQTTTNNNNTVNDESEMKSAANDGSSTINSGLKTKSGTTNNNNNINDRSIMKSAANDESEAKLAANDESQAKLVANDELTINDNNNNNNIRLAANDESEMKLAASNELTVNDNNNNDNIRLEMKTITNDDSIATININNAGMETTTAINDKSKASNTMNNRINYQSPAQQSLNERKLLRGNPSFKLIFKDHGAISNERKRTSKNNKSC